MPERIPQIEADNLLHIQQQLNAKRLVQAEFQSQLRHEFRRCRPGLAGQHIGGVSRRQLQQQEIHRHNDQDRRYRLK